MGIPLTHASYNRELWFLPYLTLRNTKKTYTKQVHTMELTNQLIYTPEHTQSSGSGYE